MARDIAIAELLADLPAKILGGSATLRITDLTDDSRKVAPGSLFIARSGAGGTDGQTYVQDALARGAAALLVGPGRGAETLKAAGADTVVAEMQADQPVNQALAGTLAERFFDHPSQKLKLVGVTGTNGKTTTSFILQHLLKAAGLHTGLMGTIFTDLGGPLGQTPATLTTPGAIDFSRMLASMVKNHCAAAVAEVSSHALHQGRTAALHFNAGVFTNLSRDHLDYHGDMDHYAASKATLFDMLGPSDWAIINADDPYAHRIGRACRAKTLLTTLQPSPPQISESQTAEQPRFIKTEISRAQVLQLTASNSRARFTGPWGSIEATLPYVGKHNISNALQALAAAYAITDISTKLRNMLSNCPTVPGRLERVASNKPNAPAVLVDYAHTDDALDNVLQAIRPLTPGRLIVVFGCGGDRDRGKRPMMAKVACNYADGVIITSDNPRTENPKAIIDDIRAGIPAKAKSRVIIEPDRAQAIALAIREAREDDTVLIAGKGHENYQIVGTEKRHFDDREQAAAALA